MGCVNAEVRLSPTRSLQERAYGSHPTPGSAVPMAHTPSQSDSAQPWASAANCVVLWFQSVGNTNGIVLSVFGVRRGLKSLLIYRQAVLHLKPYAFIQIQCSCGVIGIYAQFGFSHT